MRKKFGQNFLINPGAREQLLDALGIGKGDSVWEIGSGLGAMTAGLLERGAAVTAFEFDRGFIALLQEFFGGQEGFSLVPGDVLKTWPKTRSPGEYLLGNLPYSIGAVLLADFIEKNRFFKRMVVMVQREVARRIAAGPGSKDYSSFSVLCGSAYRVKPLMILKGSSFYPEPRVDSQGLSFDLRPVRIAGSPLFGPLVRCLFASRRKTVQNNLRNFIASRLRGDRRGPSDASPGIAAEILTGCGIPPNNRAENLSVEDFAALAAALERIFPAKPGAVPDAVVKGACPEPERKEDGDRF
jgi:16S rRNA (adenine1518-N6/adenine1519-N6)-dimethyltransferase